MEALSNEILVMERLITSTAEAFLAEISTTVANSLAYLLLTIIVLTFFNLYEQLTHPTTGSLSNAAQMFASDATLLKRMSTAKTYMEESAPENKDASEDEDEDEDGGQEELDDEDARDKEEEEDGNDDDDEGDPEDEPEANGDGGSGEEEEEEEDEEEEEEEDDEIPQPPAKRE